MKKLTIGENTLFLKLLLISSSFILLMACGKDSEPIEDIQPEPIEVNVYVTGIKKVNGVNRPFYLKDGKEIMLAYSGNVSATANDIFVSDGNVYVVGFINSDLTWQYHPKSAVLWKNGIIQNLEMPTATLKSEARAVFVSDKDVYVAGRHQKAGGNWVACVWKNGKVINVTDGSNIARLYDIYVRGNDLYVTGYEINDEIGTRGTYWKNGTPTVLENKNSENIVPNQITVLGSDIYVVGTGFDGIGQSAQYWKNGKQSILPSQPEQPVNYGQAITTEAGNVLIGGTLNNQPTVWRNAVSLNWNINSDPSIDAELSDMKVLKGNIFATGWRKSGKSRTLWIWKNGQEYFSTAPGSHYTPNGLFVVERY
ncbi:hypothetical protein AAW12_24250 [Sphingobacterium sp. Ag1]|uniref:hypothetical protein n=1 Tax=Sphingobacterium sp. Ag1 TaxID=1643451 RepID=UPI00062826B5|nr:hypothetical protein [Sphingobacterium sp. Ag1]KKO89226.1 hypothetical protein AAW12_24250 [Sphingobacterium sp. Ag1]